jgi:hypothetical protein
MRGILILALALGMLGAVAAASMAHSIGHTHGKVAITRHWMW